LSQDEHPELKSRGYFPNLHTFHTGRGQIRAALQYSQSSARPNLDRWLDMKSVSLRSGASKASLASREQFMPSSVLSIFLSSHDQNPSQHQHTPSLSKIPSPNLSPISNPHSPHHLAIQPVPYTPLTLPASQQAPLVAHGITSSIAHPPLISSNHPDSSGEMAERSKAPA
jgi:hypothetical protein